MTKSAAVLVSRLFARARLKHLQVLVKVVELGSLKRAAQAFGMTQPAVTQVVSDLESLLEIELFQRHARGVRPSPYCEEIIPMARQVIEAVSTGMNAMVARIEQGSGTVRIGSIKAAITGFLGEALARFSEQNPSIAVHVVENLINELLVLLQKGVIDMIACRKPTLMPERYEFIPVSEDQMAVVCSPEHPLIRKGIRQFFLDELAEELWVATPVGTLSRDMLDQTAAQYGWSPHYVYVSSLSIDLTQALLYRRHLLVLTPCSIVRPALDAGRLVTIPLCSEVFPSIDPLGLLVCREIRKESDAKLVEFIKATTD